MGHRPGVFSVGVEQSADEEPWKEMRFYPDSRLYGTVGATCRCFQGF